MGEGAVALRHVGGPIRYIRQGSEPSCRLVAMLNALRYYRLWDIPEPGDPRWAGLLWVFGCVAGPCTTEYEEMSALWAIDAEQGGDAWPRIVNVLDPEEGDGGHAIFEPQRGVVVNYHYRTGPLVEVLDVEPYQLGTQGLPWWSLDRGESLGLVCPGFDACERFPAEKCARLCHPGDGDTPQYCAALDPFRGLD